MLESKGDSKNLYRFMKELTGSKSENPKPTVNEVSNLDEKFANHFMGQIAKIRESLKDFGNFEPTMKKLSNFDVFKELSEDELKI